MTDKMEMDKGGKPDVCPKHDNGNSSYVSETTKAINIECLSPSSDKGKEKPLSEEALGCFEKKGVCLNRKASMFLILRILEQAKEDWYRAMKKLENDSNDTEAHETICEVESFLVGDDYRKYREICDQLPQNPLQQFLERWGKTHTWEEMETSSASELDY